MKRSLHFAGRAVNLRTRGPVSRALAEFLFGRVPAVGEGRAQLSFSLEDDGADVRFSLPGQPAAARGDPGQVVSRVLYEVDHHLADRCRGGLYLHAGCVAREGLATLLPAGSGSGKSTLTYWLTRRGYQYMSDEASFIPAGSQVCSGFTRPVHLKKGALGLFPELESAPRMEVCWTADNLIGWLVGCEALNAAPMPAELPVERIVFPTYRAGAALECERISPALAAFELARGLVNARNLPGHGFPEIAQLARKVPAWRLSYGGFEQVEAFFS